MDLGKKLQAGEFELVSLMDLVYPIVDLLFLGKGDLNDLFVESRTLGAVETQLDRRSDHVPVKLEPDFLLILLGNESGRILLLDRYLSQLAKDVLKGLFRVHQDEPYYFLQVRGENLRFYHMPLSYSETRRYVLGKHDFRKMHFYAPLLADVNASKPALPHLSPAYLL